jgi:hypothetical protein
MTKPEPRDLDAGRTRARATSPRPPAVRVDLSLSAWRALLKAAGVAVVACVVAWALSRVASK